MTPIERAFLERLNGFRSGRCGWPVTTYEHALLEFTPLIREGYVRERRYHRSPGFQITDKGREYLGGVVE